CAMRGLHLSGRVLVLLPGGFPYRLTIETEFVPVDCSSLVDRHLLISVPSFWRCVFCGVWFLRPAPCCFSRRLGGHIRYCNKSCCGGLQPGREDSRSQCGRRL